MNKISWGIISTAKIGREKVIPAIQKAENCNVVSVASRSSKRAQKLAGKLNIERSYGSYEELLADPKVQAVYIPLPNHLHVPWTIKAMKARKHVLCEKPIALNSKEAMELNSVNHKFPDLKVMEAFMYRFHPQWKQVKNLVDQGKIGELQTIESFFSYNNMDPENIRNKKEMGGGGLMDIGCYCISLSRFLFNQEPTTISGSWKKDHRFKSDYLASGVMDFDTGFATFTCSTQTSPHQNVTIVGTEGRLVIEIPFNAPPDKETRVWLYKDNQRKEITFPPVDQYTLQAQEFAKAIVNNTHVPTPLSDAHKNMKIIDAFRKSARELKVINLS